MQQTLLTLSLILILGISAQWLGWRLRLPAILLLLLFGLAAGPVTGFIDPQALLGPLLYPTVSLGVAVILFEGGLSLTVKELRAVGGVALRLVSIGAAVSWLLAALGGRFILGLDWGLAILLGAILVVTGPTVIGPLLQQIRPAGAVGPILKWEGIVIDPIGALLAILVFQVVTTPDTSPAALAAMLSKTFLFGGLLGAAGAGGLVWLLRHDLVPDHLQSPVTLMLVVSVFTLANLLQHESGLLAVTVMGFTLANQRAVAVHHIVEFKENLRVMLIAVIFILLAASLRPADLGALGLASIEFLVFLIVVVRPVAVFLATLGARLAPRERLFLAALAPRGIIAAAVASIFALRLAGTGYPNSESLVAITFFVIIGTVTVYGFAALPLARHLGLAKAHPDGILFLGGEPWVRRIAKFLHDEGFPVMIVDDNRRHILAARMEGIPATYTGVFSQPVLEQVELGGIGKFFGVSANEDANTLAGLHFARLFGSEQIYRVLQDDARPGEAGHGPRRGKALFGEQASLANLRKRANPPWHLKKTPLSKEFDFDAFMARYLGEAMPLFAITEEGHLKVFTADQKATAKPGQTLISLVRNDARPA
ncbi:sodium:proton antiporter [Parasulfuritortus cantonensis]|uniref:Sodium:proton antiporter n=1 Tax=Parasulfuritortus cantonensis TaxID=2528202 RepID=A0A4R1B5Z0_9PROT|nr:sodium:proton antiporter [Parasulfuritortus cantonensis]TCJ12980.1 sodium:proton antiporter [Parasulfuritortus cantonensis]